MKITTDEGYPGHWQAWAGDMDAEFIDGSWRACIPVGHGKSEAEAIADLHEQMEDGA